MKRLLFVAVLAGLAGSASACINDNELPTHEREFKSHYRGNLIPPAVTQNGMAGYWLLGWAGTVLLTGGVVLALTGGRVKG